MRVKSSPEIAIEKWLFWRFQVLSRIYWKLLSIHLIDLFHTVLMEASFYELRSVLEILRVSLPNNAFPFISLRNKFRLIIHCRGIMCAFLRFFIHLLRRWFPECLLFRPGPLRYRSRAQKLDWILKKSNDRRLNHGLNSWCLYLCTFPLRTVQFDSFHWNLNAVIWEMRFRFTMASSNDLKRAFLLYFSESDLWDSSLNEAICLWREKARMILFVPNESPYSINVHWISHGNNILICLSSPRSLLSARTRTRGEN